MLIDIKVLLSSSAAVLLGLASHPLHAQAMQTAQQRVRIDFYGMLSYVRPDFLGTPRAVGVTAGGSVNGIRVLPYTDLGLEVRGVTSHSDVLNESSLAGGPRVSFSRYRLLPYAEYMFGIGRGSFNNPTYPDYMRDYTAIRSYGGGVDYRLTRDFGLQADVQRQRWRFSYLSPYFHPMQVSVGVRYRLHLRSRTGPQ